MWFRNMKINHRLFKWLKFNIFNVSVNFNKRKKPLAVKWQIFFFRTSKTPYDCPSEHGNSNTEVQGSASFLGYSRRGRNDSKNETRVEKACEINIIGKLKSFMGWTQKIWPLLSFHGNERKSWFTLVRTTPFFWLLNKSVGLCDSFGYLILFVRRCSLHTA